MSSLFDIRPPPRTIPEIHAKWAPCRKCFFSHGFPKGPCLPAGSKGATVLVVGQSPGEKDMEIGIPFSGPQGEVCRQFLREAGFVERELFYTNVLLCSCPVALPSKQILENCEGQLDEVIAVVKPKLIIALGAQAAARLRVKEMAGRRPEYRGIPVATSPHPASINRAKAREEKQRITDEVRAALDAARRLYLHGE